MTINIDTTYWRFLVYAIIIIVFVFLIYLLFEKIISFFHRPELYGLSREGIKKQWEQVEDLFAQNEEISWKLAIMEADKLLDYTLKSMAIPGLNLGERLRFIQHKYPKIRQVWSAHRIRNKLAHESGFHLNHKQAKTAIKEFKKALEELSVL